MINIHVDIDNLWIYEKEYNISFNKNPDYIFEYSLPYMLRIFEKHEITATLFFVGRDLEMDSAKKFIKTAIQCGHKIGNHTYSHSMNWSSFSFNEKGEEIRKCHDAILEITGYKPIGFRSPGYYLNNEIINILTELDYAYDSSILPGYATLLMGLYTKLKKIPSKNKAFGRAQYLFMSENRKTISPYGSKKTLYELPISVMPILRLPTHTSFIYIFGKNYLNLMKKMYQFFPRNRIHLFHAVDFVNIQNKLSPVPAFRLPFLKKIELMEEILLFLKNLSGKIDTTESNFNSPSPLSLP